MSASRTIPRLLTALYALIAVPASMLLLGYAISTWTEVIGGGSALPDVRRQLATPLGTELYVSGGIGLALLAGVVLSGLLSSAGLLVSGLYVVVGVLVMVLPALHRDLYGLISEPRALQGLSGLDLGLPLVITPLLLGMGIAVLLARRRARDTSTSSLPGMLLVPLLVAAGWYLLLESVLRGRMTWSSALEAQASSLVIGLVIGGTVLLVLAGITGRWSPAALTVPGILVLFATVIFQNLTVVTSVSSLGWPGGGMLAEFFQRGGGVPLGLVLIVGWVTLAIVALRSRRRARREADRVALEASTQRTSQLPEPSGSSGSSPESAPKPGRDPESATMPRPPRTTSSSSDATVAPIDPVTSSRET